MWHVLHNKETKKQLDPQLHSFRCLKYFSSHTAVEYQRYKRLWPTSPRDFGNLMHWRLLNSGAVVMVSFSEKYEDMCPLEEGVVRAELIMSALVLKQLPQGGCTVHFMAQVYY